MKQILKLSILLVICLNFYCVLCKKNESAGKVVKGEELTDESDKNSLSDEEVLKVWIGKLKKTKNNKVALIVKKNRSGTMIIERKNVSEDESRKLINRFTTQPGLISYSKYLLMFDIQQILTENLISMVDMPILPMPM
jgi:hypothetical protein